MPVQLPHALEEAMSRLLDAAHSELNASPASRIERIALLRSAREMLSEWRKERLTTDQAVARIDALIASLRSN